MSWQGLSWSGRLAWATQRRQTAGLGRLCWILPHFPDPQKVHGSALGKQQAVPWGGGQAAGQPLLLPCAVKASAGKAERLKLQLRGKHLRPGSLQLLLDWHQHIFGTSIFPSPAAWTALAFTSTLCRHRRPIQAVRYIWLSSGDRETETRQSSSRWDKGFQSEMGSKKTAEIKGTTGLLSRKRNIPESFSTAILGDQGKKKEWSTLMQKRLQVQKWVKHTYCKEDNLLPRRCTLPGPTKVPKVPKIVILV